MQDVVRTSRSRAETTTEQQDDLFVLDIPDLIKNLLKLLSDDGVLYFSTNEEDPLQIITLIYPIVPFLSHHLRDDHFLHLIRTEEFKRTNWILKYAETDQFLCKVPSWKWNLILCFLHEFQNQPNL